MKTRRFWRVLGSAALALLLAGCFKVNMDLDVTADNTVSGTAVIAVEESLLELSGQSVDQLFADMDLSELPPGSKAEPYDEDGFVGRQITFEAVPLGEFTGNGALSGAASGEDLNIVREGDEFRVTGGFDMSGQEFTGSEIPQQFLDNVRVPDLDHVPRTGELRQRRHRREHRDVGAAGRSEHARSERWRARSRPRAPRS